MSKQQLQSGNEKVPWWVVLCRGLWKFSVFLGVSVVLALGVNVVSTWLTSPGGKLPPDAPVNVLVQYWPLAVLMSICFLLLAAVFFALSRWKTSAQAPALPTTLQYRTRMLGRLRVRYERLLIQTFHDVVRVELGLASRPAAIQDATSLALRLPAQPDQLLSPHTSIVDMYEQAQQELLILGEPGTGKSTLLLDLALYLLHQAEQDETQPLPFVLPLASWANHRLPFQEWLIEQVKELYDVSQSLSQQWVEAEQILPLLDGLDEMEEAARAECVAAINTYHREHLRPLVVCSRTQEYERATRQEQLVLHTAVVVQPLSLGQVESHLVTLGKPLAALRTMFKKNVTLAVLATNPLMLQVLILTYRGTTVRQLSEQAPVLERQVWRAYIERMVQQKGDRRRYPLNRTLRWLTWLARLMRDNNITVFTYWLEPLELGPRPKHYNILHRGSTILFWELVFGLLFGLGGELVFGLPKGLGGGLVFGLLFGLLEGLETEKTGFWENLRGDLSGLLLFGLHSILIFKLSGGLVGLRGWLERLLSTMTGLHGDPVGLFGVISLLLSLSIGGLVSMLVSSVVSGLIGGLVTGLVSGLRIKQLIKREFLSTHEEMLQHLLNGCSLLLVIMSIIILGSILSIGLVIGRVNVLNSELGIILGIGLVVGGGIGLVVGPLFLMEAYITRFWL